MAEKIDESTPLGWGDTAWDAETVDISSTDFTPTKFKTARGLYVGTGGDVKLLTAGGTTLIFPSVPAGFILPMAFTKIVKVGTGASGMVALGG